MQVEIVLKEPLLVVSIRENRLDSALALEFQTLIEEWIEAGFFHIVLDLTEVDFIDSTILGVIVQWFKRLRMQPEGGPGLAQGNLVICNIGFKVRSLFQLTRMDRVLAIYDGNAEAIQALTGKAS